MANSTATPILLTDPGFLFWAPLASSVPTNTVTGSAFTDSWPVAWINLGATDNGATFNYTTTVEARSVAEFLDPIQWATTSRNGNFAFNLASFTLSNLKKALNGGSLSVVSGTGATTLNSYTPPTPGQEVRCMIGWESLDATMRIVAYQTLNAATISAAFQKAPAYATIPTQFNFEVPSSGTPFQVWTAGVARG